MVTMSQKEYAGHKNKKCPACGSKKIDPQGTETYLGVATQEIGCDDCGSLWKESYSFSGFEMLIDSNKEK